jgi:hypothetical protein
LLEYAALVVSKAHKRETMSNSRMFTGYILVATFDRRTTYFGPFPTEQRALEYCMALSIEKNGEVMAEIKELTVPHAMHVFVETQY